jgi:uncharacterized protein (TIGR02217 family)
MSNLIFPSLPGIAWDCVRTPLWQTRRQQSVSGKVTAMADWQYPLCKYQLSYDFLRSDPTFGELQTLTGFFQAMSGGFDTFLYTDPDDNSVTNQTIGTTDGVSSAFQLVRTFGGFTEPVYTPANVTSVTLGGTAFMGYSVNATTGLLSFGEIPAAGLSIVASFSYYWRCRFSDDSIDFDNFASGLFEVKQLNFERVK